MVCLSALRGVLVMEGIDKVTPCGRILGGDLNGF